MDPNNREQGDNTQDMSAADPTGEEGGAIQGLTDAMAAARMFDFEGDPIPTPGLVGDADADLEATQQHHQPRPLEPLPSATTTGAAGATGATGTADHDGAATSPSGPQVGFSFDLAGGTKLNEATTKTPGTGAAFNFGSPSNFGEAAAMPPPSAAKGKGVFSFVAAAPPSPPVAPPSGGATLSFGGRPEAAGANSPSTFSFVTAAPGGAASAITAPSTAVDNATASSQPKFKFNFPASSPAAAAGDGSHGKVRGGRST